MARARNEELRELITRTAWKQFRERGYDKTTFASIAEECGVSRELAHYHIGKKETLAIDLIDHVAEEAMAALGPGYDDGSTLAVYAGGSCSFNYLVNVGGFGRLLLDVLSRRELTDKLVDVEVKWMRGLSTGGANPQEADRLLTMVIGGFNELMYTQLSASGTCDVFELVAFAINAARTLYRQSASGETDPLPKDAEFVAKIAEASARIRL